MQHKQYCTSPEHVGISTYSQTLISGLSAMQTMLWLSFATVLSHLLTIPLSKAMSAFAWLKQRGSCTNAWLTVHAGLTAIPSLLPLRLLMTRQHLQRCRSRASNFHAGHTCPLLYYVCYAGKPLAHGLSHQNDDRYLHVCGFGLNTTDVVGSGSTVFE